MQVPSLSKHGSSSSMPSTQPVAHLSHNTPFHRALTPHYINTSDDIHLGRKTCV
ncbi:hypothetical protein L208DRAFT_1390508 [Tricholoma matsutake]|nr:hypothetical protein L208DRAFT_1390508 [Tricholoma matsutake 945]